MLIQIATSSYKSASLPVSAQRVKNLYAEREPPDAKTPVAVFGSPGIVLFGTAGTGPVRGFDVMGGVLYVVSGGHLYSVTSLGIASQLGGTISGTDVVSMDNNGTELVITNGVNGYIYSVTGGFRLITDTDFNAANTVRFLDQRFVFDEAGTNRFFCSDVLDGTAYQALAFASAESRPDNVLAVEVNSQVLFVFGEQTIEPHQNVGAANFPWERVPGAVIARGLAAKYCIAKEDSTIFFLGDDLVFYKFAGMNIQRISTHALEAEWRGYAATSDAFAFGWSWHGHKFVTVTFPTANTTFEYDISTGLWHERESWDEFENPLGRWRANCHVSVYNKQLIGDCYSGKIGYLDESTNTEFDNVIHAYAVFPPVHSDRKRVFFSRIELDVETGVGVVSGQGSDPQIMLDWSDDGGRTFVNRQLWRSMGALGAYRSRLKWTRLGSSRDRRYRITISDPVPRTIIAANADVTVGL